MTMSNCLCKSPFVRILVLQCFPFLSAFEYSAPDHSLTFLSTLGRRKGQVTVQRQRKDFRASSKRACKLLCLSNWISFGGGSEGYISYVIQFTNLHKA